MALDLGEFRRLTAHLPDNVPIFRLDHDNEFASDSYNQDVSMDPEHEVYLVRYRYLELPRSRYKKLPKVLEVYTDKEFLDSMRADERHYEILEFFVTKVVLM